MKKNLILQTLVLLFFVFAANAQRGINYKAIIKDGGGAAIVNTAVTVQFTILERITHSGGFDVARYQETHTPTTDANGIVIVNIGEGNVKSGVFDDIDWGRSSYLLKTEINTGSGLTDMGTTEFKTVPYALYAESSAGDITELNDLSDAITTGSSLFIGNYTGVNDDGTSNNNTAVGHYSLLDNINGMLNTALGQWALSSNMSSENTAVGFEALRSNTTGLSNTAVGTNALGGNETGKWNTAIGQYALYGNKEGNWNIAIGYRALQNNTTGSNNIAIGYDAQVPDGTAINQVQIGNNDIELAGCHVAWTLSSDIRWKENIRNLPYGLDMLMQLKPVDYNRKNNENKTREMGFIAQDVEKVFNKMGYTDQGILIKDYKGYLHLRYNDFIVLLTKAVQEQQVIINSLNDKLEKQEKNNIGLSAELDQLKALENRIRLIEDYQRVAEK